MQAAFVTLPEYYLSSLIELEQSCPEELLPLWNRVFREEGKLPQVEINLLVLNHRVISLFDYLKMLHLTVSLHLLYVQPDSFDLVQTESMFISLIIFLIVIEFTVLVDEWSLKVIVYFNFLLGRRGNCVLPALRVKSGHVDMLGRDSLVILWEGTSTHNGLELPSW